jgi:hypothetical protein
MKTGLPHQHNLPRKSLGLRILFVTLCLVASVSCESADSPSQPSSKPSSIHSAAVVVPPQEGGPGRSFNPAEVIQKAVVFLYQKPTPGSIGKPDASGFILSVPQPDSPNGSHNFSLFLVTARHVVDEDWGGCGLVPASGGKLYIRAYKPGSPSPGFLPVEVSIRGRGTVFTLEDDAVDLAAVLLLPSTVQNLPQYDLGDVPFRIVVTDAEMSSIHVSQEVVTAGLFPRFPGSTQNLPIYRKGVVSQIPKDPVRLPCVKNLPIARDVYAWLVSAPLRRGFSGAPIFTTLQRGDQNRAPVLLGIQSFAWEEDQLAGMTPATRLAELIRKAMGPNPRADLYQGPGQSKLFLWRQR